VHHGFGAAAIGCGDVALRTADFFELDMVRRATRKCAISGAFLALSGAGLALTAGGNYPGLVKALNRFWPPTSAFDHQKG
jgi:hypothetical protein